MPPPVDDHDAPQARLQHNWSMPTILPEQWARALIEAVRTGHDINVNMLLKHGLAHNAYDTEILGCALIAAVESRQPGMVQPLLNSGAHIDFVSPVDGDTALTVALANQDWPMAQFLLMLGAHPDLPDPMTHNTPLMVAIIEEDWTAAILLVQYGANLDLAQPDTGQTPWMLAQVLGHSAMLIEMLSRLVHHDAQPQSCAASGQENDRNLPVATDSADGDGAGNCPTPVQSASEIEPGQQAPHHAPADGDSHAADDAPANTCPSMATGLAPVHEP